ncbi:hypothetical protein [Listeria aquatica]|uniref:hypothetical protein n=1 Tax=Listeria aquatica TaxID=1494960 RepID=UPI0031F5700C
MTRKKAIKRYKIKAQNLTLRKSLLIKDLDNDFENILIIEQYNLGVWKEDSILALREAYAENWLVAMKKALKHGALLIS